jgi:hypothetical protein
MPASSHVGYGTACPCPSNEALKNFTQYSPLPIKYKNIFGETIGLLKHWCTAKRLQLRRSPSIFTRCVQTTARENVQSDPQRSEIRIMMPFINFYFLVYIRLTDACCNCKEWIYFRICKFQCTTIRTYCYYLI